MQDEKHNKVFRLLFIQQQHHKSISVFNRVFVLCLEESSCPIANILPYLSTSKEVEYSFLAGNLQLYPYLNK